MRWGNPAYPGLTLVGKGVTFDGGGKFSKIEQMRFMKNDMAGAAHAMAVAYMIMHAQFPVHLRVLLPIVENSEGPKAYKPDDVYFSSSGKSVEIVNTDCEGRVIMGDALYEASHPSYQNAKKPRRIVDFGTLSWHGDSEYPGFNSVFCNNPALHELFLQSTRDCQEEFIHRPLMPYLGRELDDSLIADMRQASDDHYSYDDLLAALYLLKHVGMEVPWLHCDLQIWRVPKDVRTKYPANVPDGAFPAGIRSTYQFIRNDYKTDQFPFTF
jgi:leucyl aminopeptidase